MSRSSQTHFGVVDQAIKSMETVEEYISVGMETTIDVAIDLVENDKGADTELIYQQSGQHDNDSGIKDLEDVMISYIKMERDLKRFHDAVDEVKIRAHSSGNSENNDLEALLDKILSEMPSDDVIQHHDKLSEFKERIFEIRNPDKAMPQASGTVDEDIALTQQEVNIRCPYTGKDMKHPVRNKTCGHSYDKEGILHYIKSKGKRAKCPVSGCGNDKVMDNKELEENKELKRYIDRMLRQAGKRHGDSQKK